MKHLPDSLAEVPAQEEPTRNPADISFEEFLEECLRIQPRFIAEPVFAKTGKGFLRSAGVKDMQLAKQRANGSSHVS